MVDDIITDGKTKIESINLIRKLCEAEVKGVIFSLDRIEKNSKGIDTINQFNHITGIPVFSIFTIRQIYDYLRNNEFDDSIKLEEKKLKKMKDYLSINCIKS